MSTTNTAHAEGRCCCKWHGSACCHDQFREMERRVAERLVETATPKQADA